MYLNVKVNNSIISYDCKPEEPPKPYIKVSSQYLQLVSTGTTQPGLHVKIKNINYVPKQEQYSTVTIYSGYYSTTRSSLDSNYKYSITLAGYPHINCATHSNLFQRVSSSSKWAISQSSGSSGTCWYGVQQQGSYVPISYSITKTTNIYNHYKVTGTFESKYQFYSGQYAKSNNGFFTSTSATTTMSKKSSSGTGVLYWSTTLTNAQSTCTSVRSRYFTATISTISSAFPTQFYDLTAMSNVGFSYSTITSGVATNFMTGKTTSSAPVYYTVTANRSTTSSNSQSYWYSTGSTTSKIVI